MRAPVATLAVLGALVTGALGACTTPSSGGGVPPLNPVSRFVLQVEPGLDRIALAVHDQGLSANQRHALDQLVSRFAAHGAPYLVVETPAGADPSASRMAWEVQSYLISTGVPAERVRVAGYHAPDARAPVLASFEVLRAHVPDCSQQWTNLTATRDNGGYAAFGCAVSANLAAQIANPRDILEPRAMTAPDGGRRTVVIDLYRSGEVTSAQREPGVGDQVAQAVQ